MENRRKIGAIIPLWNQELFIKPHLDMLTRGVDRILVLSQGGPLPNYHKEHGYSVKKDRSEDIIRHYFPQVEIVESAFPWQTMDFSAPLYNEGLVQMKDCDIVFRLDPDMFWIDEDWDKLISFVRSTDFDCYRMKFATDSVNYYMTGDYDHGLKDAREYDPLLVSPKNLFQEILDYPDDNMCILDLGIMCHHFRCWNKPKSTGPDWVERPFLKDALKAYGDNGKFWKCPEEIKVKIESWLEELNTKWKNQPL